LRNNKDVLETVRKKSFANGLLYHCCCSVLGYWKLDLLAMQKLKQIFKFLLFLEDNPKHKVLEPHSWMAVAIVYASWFLAFVSFAYLLPYGFIALILGIVTVPIVLVETLHVLYDR
jgi:hypothetical protein